MDTNVFVYKRFKGDCLQLSCNNSTTLGTQSRHS